MNINMKNKILVYYFGFFALLYFLTVIVGILNNYSPVPFWDMWNGYLEFYIKAQSGDWHVWFVQHNEHRVFLSRILFWIDIHFFDGASYFLIICNVLLMVGIVCLFFGFVSDLFKERATKLHLLGLIVILMFSWIQNNNITWGFQSQFFLAYLVPLLAFYLLARNVDTNQNIFYISALLAGVLSVFTMGNGILALPLLIVLGFVLKLSKLRQLILIVVTVLTLMIYFSDYVAPAGHGSLTQTLLHQPKEFILYIFTYLGGPIGYAIGKSKLLVIQLFGCLFMVSSLYFTYKAFKEENKKPLILAILIFIAYIGATAFGTAGGRLLFGVEHAIDSRYMTPVLMGWISLFILIFYFYRNKSKNIVFLFMLIPLIFLPRQFEAFKFDDYIFVKKIAVLSLALGIKDKEYTGNIFPNYDWLLKLAKEPREKHLSIFASEDLKDISMMMGKTLKKTPSKNLIGSFDEFQNISDNNKFLRMRGWVFDDISNQIPSSLFVVDENNMIIGYILTGQRRQDVADVINRKALLSGYNGYIENEYINKSFFLVTTDFNKKLSINLINKNEKYQAK